MKMTVVLPVLVLVLGGLMGGCVDPYAYSDLGIPYEPTLVGPGEPVVLPTVLPAVTHESVYTTEPGFYSDPFYLGPSHGRPLHHHSRSAPPPPPPIRRATSAQGMSRVHQPPSKGRPADDVGHARRVPSPIRPRQTIQPTSRPQDRVAPAGRPQQQTRPKDRPSTPKRASRPSGTRRR